MLFNEQKEVVHNLLFYWVVMKKTIEATIRKNSIHTVTIDSLDSRGFGVSRIDGIVVFVEGALPGETVTIQIIKSDKRYCVGKVLSLISKSENRVASPCPLFPRCGGCDLQHMSYKSQLEMKEKMVRDAFIHIAKITEPTISRIIPSPRDMRYRNKGSFPVSLDGKLGFYRKHSHIIIPCDDCLTQSETTMKACRVFEYYIKKYNVSIYNETTGNGLLRHFVVRTNTKNEIHITIVSTSGLLPNKQEMIDLFLKEIPTVVGIVLNINKRRDNVILGDNYTSLWGSDKLEEKIGDRTFSVSPASFFQINKYQIETLYGVVKRYIEETGAKRVIDLYCGTGTIGIFISDLCEQVKGIEVVPEAIVDAYENAKRNGIKNISFECGKAETLIKGITDLDSFDTVIVDPPRSGCDRKLIEELCANRLKTIIYVSCNPGTLARDVDLFTTNGYMINKIQPVDMFPMSNHIETVCLLTHS